MRPVEYTTRTAWYAAGCYVTAMIMSTSIVASGRLFAGGFLIGSLSVVVAAGYVANAQSFKKLLDSNKSILGLNGRLLDELKEIEALNKLLNDQNEHLLNELELSRSK